MGNTIMMQFSSELRILGLLVSFPETFADEVFASVHAGMFTGDIERRIFEICKDAHESKQPIGVDLFAEESSQLALVLDAVTTYALSSGSSLKPSIQAMQVKHSERIVKSAIIEANKLLEDGEPIAEIWKHFDSTREELVINEVEELKPMKVVIDENSSIEGYEDLSRSILKTGLSNLDRNLIVRSGDLIILAGRPSMGKTDVALQIGKRNAQNGKGTGIISLEMQPKYLLKRMALSESHLQSTDYDNYLKGCERLYGLNIVFDNSYRHDIHTIRSQTKRFVNVFGINLLVIDYLTLIQPPKAQNMNIALMAITRSLKELATELNIAILLLSQLSRACEQRSDKQPMLSDLRESGAIEQDADSVLFVYRPIYYDIKEINDIADTTNYLRLILAKQRDGRTGKMDMFYDPARKIFDEWEGFRLEPATLKPVEITPPDMAGYPNDDGEIPF